MKRWLYGIAAFWALLLLFTWLTNNVFISDEKRVLRQIEVLRAAVEQGNLLKLEDNITQDFQGDEDVDKRTVIAAVRELRRENPDWSVSVARAVVRVYGDTAEADVRGRIVSKQERIAGGHFRLGFRKVEKAWKLNSLHHIEGDNPRSRTDATSTAAMATIFTPSRIK